LTKHWDTQVLEAVRIVNEKSADSLTIVVVEKPFVTTSEKADELIALAKEKGKILTVFHSTSTI
jgi:hypothetical protein